MFAEASSRSLASRLLRALAVPPASAPTSAFADSSRGNPWSDALRGGFALLAVTSIVAFALSNPARAQSANEVTIDPPSSAAGTYPATGASFGPSPTTAGLSGNVVLVNDGSGDPTLGCDPLVGFPAGAIALIDRGDCVFTLKVSQAQAAGAVAVIVVNNVVGSPIAMGGSDPTIMIPTVMISLADGSAIKSGLPATGTVRALAADLALTKTAEYDGVLVIFTITVLNQGPADATSVEVIDILPDQVSYVSDDCGGVNFPPWAWLVGSLANGASETCIITTMPVSRTVGLVSNTATVSSEQIDPDPDSAGDTAEVFVVDPASAPALGWSALLLTGVLLAAIAARRLRPST